MRSSSVNTSASPAGRRHPVTDDALGQDPGVSHPPESLFEKSGQVIAFPIGGRSRVVMEQAALIRLDEALAVADHYLAEAAGLIAELTGFPLETFDEPEQRSTASQQAV